jgi:hypothetical protein
MGIGKFFVREGIWLWKIWDERKAKDEYEQKKLAGLAEHNPNSMWTCPSGIYVKNGFYI